MIRPLILTLVLAALTGCTGLGTLRQASKPNDLYLLTPKSTFSSSLPRIQKQIVVEEPTATAAVNTDQLRAALSGADLRCLTMVLLHLTGDKKWLGERYRPARDINLIADEAGREIEGVYRIDAPGKITRIIAAHATTG